MLAWQENKEPSIQGQARKTPNDPKLSDGGGWRAGCMVGGKAAAEAASVTAGAVRGMKGGKGNIADGEESEKDWQRMVGRR